MGERSMPTPIVAVARMVVARMVIRDIVKLVGMLPLTDLLVIP